MFGKVDELMNEFAGKQDDMEDMGLISKMCLRMFAANEKVFKLFF